MIGHSAGAYLVALLATDERYLAAQGTRLGRAGRVRIVREGATICVGGDTVTCIRGDVEL